MSSAERTRATGTTGEHQPPVVVVEFARRGRRLTTRFVLTLSSFELWFLPWPREPQSHRWRNPAKLEFSNGRYCGAQICPRGRSSDMRKWVLGVARRHRRGWPWALSKTASSSTRASAAVSSPNSGSKYTNPMLDISGAGDRRHGRLERRRRHGAATVVRDGGAAVTSADIALRGRYLRATVGLALKAASRSATVKTTTTTSSRLSKWPR